MGFQFFSIPILRIMELFICPPRTGYLIGPFYKFDDLSKADENYRKYYKECIIHDPNNANRKWPRRRWNVWKFSLRLLSQSGFDFQTLFAETILKNMFLLFANLKTLYVFSQIGAWDVYFGDRTNTQLYTQFNWICGLEYLMVFEIL